MLILESRARRILFPAVSWTCLTCTGSVGSFAEVGQPPTVTLEADPPSVMVGGASTLTWTSTNATDCLSDGWTAVTTTSGSEVVMPSVGTTYTLTCDGFGGSTTVHARINIAPTFVGRIALSTDGNDNDPDDWVASPTAFAIIHSFGASSRIVHFDYNSILCQNDPVMQSEHASSVAGGASRFGGISPAVIFDDQSDADGARRSIAAAIDASSAADPLYFVIAGPTQIVYEGVSLADPSRLRHVWFISHHAWNDGYQPGAACNTIRSRDLIDLGVNWVQLRDQNGDCSSRDSSSPGFCTSPVPPATVADFAPWDWLRTSNREALNWLYGRMLVAEVADASDAGMTYFLLSGNELGTIDDLRSLLDDNRLPPSVDARPTILLEAENFRTLSNYELAVSREASHGAKVVLADGVTAGAIHTLFNELYAATDAAYDVRIRYFDSSAATSTFTFNVNGTRQGPGWSGATGDDSWHVVTLSDIPLQKGDEITIEAVGAPGDRAEIDSVELLLSQ